MLFYVRNIILLFVLILTGCTHSYIPVENERIWIDFECDKRTKQIPDSDAVAKVIFWGKCWKDEALINKGE